MKQKINETIDKVKYAFPSIFTKEDVMELLEDILASEQPAEEPKVRKLSMEELHEIVHAIREKTADWIERNQENVVNLDSADFEIRHGNEIQLSSIAVNYGDIAEQVEEITMDILTGYFTPDEEEI